MFHLSNVTRKPAGTSPGIGWQRDTDDTCFFAAPEGRTVKRLSPPRPMPRANGGTAVVPGSHLPGRGDDVIDPGDSAVCPDAPAVACPALHSRAPRGVAPNRGGDGRDVIAPQSGPRSCALRCQAGELLSLRDRQAFPRLARSPAAA